jgi:hypothetical protein
MVGSPSPNRQKPPDDPPAAPDRGPIWDFTRRSGRYGRPVPSDADIELEFYETFFLEKGLEPYPVQEQAIGRIFGGQDVLVTVPTGTGKTLVAKGALLRALRSGRRAIYTTPLRALTEEKFRELQTDFGEDQVGFATGDYRVNPDAPIQVLVAEILWNRIYGDQATRPADVVVMDEGHYFNDPERGYVWEQSIIGLHPDCQLVILSATVGYPQQFCNWVYSTRKRSMALVEGTERRVPLFHEFREDYLIDTVKGLYRNEDVPALIFSFGRRLCFERARLLKSCPKFVTKEEQQEIERRLEPVLLPNGMGPEFRRLLTHGIGVHHAGVLPAYRRLVEELTSDRLLKFVVTTETIAAGINLPAKRCVFPSLKKVIRKTPRLLTPAEYHQMAGRAGRPQFDEEGIAITLAPEDVVQNARKEIKDLQKKSSMKVDEEKIKKKWYSKARADAKARGDVTWDREDHTRLVEGQPAPLQSRSKVTAEQILAIGLPNLEEESLPGLAAVETGAAEQTGVPAAGEGTGSGTLGGTSPDDSAGDSGAPAEPAAARAGPVALRGGVEPRASEPPPVARAYESAPGTRRLDILSVIDNLLLGDAQKREAHKQLAMITRNLQAVGVLDSSGRQVGGEVIGKIRGLDGVFVHHVLTHAELDEASTRELLEFLVDHDAIQRIFDRKEREARRQWILERLRILRRENPHVTFEDVEEMYEEEHPRELTSMELLHRDFESRIPHPELHGGKRAKRIWAEIEDDDLTFTDYVDRHQLDDEEGSLFTYLARVMRAAKMLDEATGQPHFATVESAIRHKLAAIDERVLEGVW